MSLSGEVTGAVRLNDYFAATASSWRTTSHLSRWIQELANGFARLSREGMAPQPPNPTCCRNLGGIEDVFESCRKMGRKLLSLNA